MKRKKETKPIQFDVSENFQPKTDGYFKQTVGWLQNQKNNSVDAIVAHGVLEQREGEERVEVMRTFHRVLKPGGKLVIQCSHWATAAASMSPFSKWPPLSPESFGFFCADVRKRSNYNNPALDDIDFDLQWQELYGPDWQAKNDTTRAFAAKHYTNVVLGLVVTMTKKEVK